MYTTYALAKARQQELIAAAAHQLATRARKTSTRRQPDTTARARLLAILRAQKATRNHRLAGAR